MSSGHAMLQSWLQTSGVSSTLQIEVCCEPTDIRNRYPVSDAAVVVTALRLIVHFQTRPRIQGVRVNRLSPVIAAAIRYPPTSRLSGTEGSKADAAIRHRTLLLLPLGSCERGTAPTEKQKPD